MTDSDRDPPRADQSQLRPQRLVPAPRSMRAAPRRKPRNLRRPQSQDDPTAIALAQRRSNRTARGLLE